MLFELPLERRDERAVLPVDRADAAEQLVVVRDLAHARLWDVAPAQDVLEERHHVVHAFGAAEGDDEHGVESLAHHGRILPLTKLVYGLDERGDVLDGSFGEYAVAEVEDVPGPVRGLFENVSGARADDRRVCEEGD